MKKLFLIVIMMLLASSAWAAETLKPSAVGAAKPVACSVKGVLKMVKSAAVCKDLGGTVAVAPAIPKKY